MRRNGVTVCVGADSLLFLFFPLPSFTCPCTYISILADPTDSHKFFLAATGSIVFHVDTSISANNIGFNTSWLLLSTVDTGDINIAYWPTANLTSPHADARMFFWDSVTGDLLTANDGGIYRRTLPTLYPNKGDWFTLAGDLAITEIYQMAGECDKERRRSKWANER